MNPRIVLSLWRERWGKAASAAPSLPYVQGRLSAWGKRLAQASIWAIPGVTVIVLAACLACAGLLVLVRFSLHDQLVISGMFTGIALILRRYAGMFVTLTLAALALLSTLRYLAWRFSDTLDPVLGISFLLGFCLLAAEIYLVLRIATTFALTVWPLMRHPVAMPAEQSKWPVVDVFLDCSNQPLDAASRSAMKFAALKWPQKKFRLHLLDNHLRQELQALAHSIHASYAASAGNDQAANPVVAMQKASGDLIVLAGCDYQADRGFLQVVGGWFMRDTRLGMLLTTDHFFAPASPAESKRLFDSRIANGACAIIRRTALAGAGGLLRDAHLRHATAPGLQANGYRVAQFGIASDSAAPQPAVSRIPGEAMASTRLVCVDQPFSVIALRWKQRLLALGDMLDSRTTLPRLIFFTVPAICLLSGADVLQTSPELLAAYALPHLLHGYFVHARLQGDRRFAVVAEFREMLLGCYLLVPTTINLIRTRLGALMWWRQAGPDMPLAPFDWRVAGPYSMVAAFNLIGITAAISFLATSGAGTPEADLLYFYLGWCSVNLLLVMSALALMQEARQIQLHRRLHAEIPAMLKLPLGRTLACTTLDFPARSLSLRLPVPLSIDDDAAITVSVFHENQEYAFPAKVNLQKPGVLIVNIDAEAHPQYMALGAAALRRGARWPQWMAGRNADRLLPQFITKGVLNLLIAMLDFVTYFGQSQHRIRLNNWILFWKK